MTVDQELHRLVQQVEGKRLGRRDLVKRGAAIGLGSSALAAGLLTLGGPKVAQARKLAMMLQDAPGSGTKGGKLRVATISEPTTIDQHMNTTEITAVISYTFMEGLFTYDATYQSIPMLVDSHTISEDGLTHTMVLRSGVTFHNGEPLTAADAVASVNRWVQLSGVGKNLMASTESITAADDLTIAWKLTRPYGTLTVALAHNTQGCVIYPKSVIDASTLEPIGDDGMIGTGPYKMVEHKPDAYIRLVRFEEYTSRTEETNGYGGKKYAYVDQIDFIPVPDEAARVAGLQAGDYDFALQVGNDQYSVLKDAPGVIAEILRPTNWDVFFLNWKSPIMENLAMREAVQAALDMLPMLRNGRGDDEFLRLDPGLMMLETPWYTDAGVERYNLNDPELAKAKLQEAGYDGAPIRFLTTTDYAYMQAEALVATQQLEAVGMTIDLQVVDWATVVERRAKPEEWDMFTTSHGFVPDPTQISYVGQMNIYPGWWSAEDSLELASELAAEADFDTRYGIWEQIQANAYTQIPAIKIGDSSNVSYRSEKIGGWVEQIERGVPFWNIWLK